MHSLFKDLTTAINSGKVKTTDLENMCIDWQNVEHQLTAVTGKTTLSIAPSPEISKSELLEKVEQFEEIQKQSWGKSANQRGEFTTDSPRWQKFNEFKVWLKSHD